MLYTVFYADHETLLGCCSTLLAGARHFGSYVYILFVELVSLAYPTVWVLSVLFNFFDCKM